MMLPQLSDSKDYKYYSFEEYLAFEEKSTYKNEYEKGQIKAMSGGTLDHSTIAQNTGTAIAVALRQKNKKCRVNNSDLKIRIEAYDKAVYPDVSVICDAATYYKERKDIITNPLLVVEVLSKSTRDYDRGTKFAQYRSLPSFKEYVLIEQETAKVEVWSKMEENVWRIITTKGLEGSISLASIGCEIKLTDIYYLIEDLKLA